MTVLTKCSTCRARKVKCDQKLPACDACVKTGRECSYRYGGPESLFVYEQSVPESDGRLAVCGNARISASGKSCTDLKLKRSCATSDGKGQYITHVSQTVRMQTFIRGQSTTADRTSGLNQTYHSNASPLLPSHPRWSRETALATQWVSMLDGAGLGRYTSAAKDVLDTWVRFVPGMLGNTPVLDVAVEYYMASMLSFLCMNEVARRRASICGQRALMELRQAVECFQPGQDPSDLLMAIVLHRYAESLRGQKSNHVPHVRAIPHVLRGSLARTRQQEAVSSVVLGTYEDELIEAIIDGKDSSYDTDGLYFASPSMEGMNDALVALQDLYVRIPQLIRLTRSALQGDKAILGDAVALAVTLYKSPQETCIRDVLATETNIKPAPQGLLPLLLGTECLEFQRLESYILATEYYNYRIYLCGLIQSLCTLDDTPEVFDLQEIQAADVAAATTIAMFAGHVFGSSKAHPIRALRYQLPLQVALSAWCRLEARQSSPSDLDTARRMKAWTMKTLGRIDEQWGLQRADPRVLESACKVAAGGLRTADLAIWRDRR